MKRKKWIQKCDADNKNLPIPTQIVSNEEFAPPAQTEDQKQVEYRLLEIASDSSQKLGISRRRFLASTGGMAAAFLAMNSVFGKFFDVDESELYEPQATAFLESISFKKPAETSIAAPPANNPIVGTWGQNLGAHMTYGDPVAAGMAGYSKDQYTFNANGTYTFVSKTFRMAYDKIILVIENGTYQISGDTLSIRPQKSVIQAWSKMGGGDKWGRQLSSQPRKLEPVTYKFTKHYFSGIDEWNLVLQADQPTERDGPFSTFKLFPNAWYYKPISSNNPVVELPN